MIETAKYVRKPLYVEGVQVTEENFTELALWCQGEIIDTSVPGGRQERHIQVRVTNPMNPRQAQARVGDWILTSGRGYKIYTPKAFLNAFDLVEDTSAPGPGARQLFESHTPMVEPVPDKAEVAATLHQEAKEGHITAEEANAAIVATPMEPVELPVGSGPMPTQPEPTDVEVKHVPAVPENLKEGTRVSASDHAAAEVAYEKDENVVYPEGYINSDRACTGDAIVEVDDDGS